MKKNKLTEYKLINKLTTVRKQLKTFQRSYFLKNYKIGK